MAWKHREWIREPVRNMYCEYKRAYGRATRVPGSTKPFLEPEDHLHSLERNGLIPRQPVKQPDYGD